MPNRQILMWAICLGAMLSAARAADSLELSAAPRAGELTRVQFQMEVGGHLKMVRNGQVQQVPMRVEGGAVYRERLIATGTEGSPLRSVRKYETARGTLSIDRRQIQPELAPGHRLIAVSLDQDSQTLFCPASLLSRDELDLIDVPISSLLVNRLLPGRAVKVGDRWRHEAADLALLLGLDAVSQADVESVLTELGDTSAQAALVGALSGAIGGVATEIELKAKYRYDPAARRIDWLAILIKENRSVGHAAPGVDVVAKLQLQIEPLADAAELADAELAGLALDPSPELTRLAYLSPGGEMSLVFPRDWQIVNEDGQVAVLRLVQRGDLVAQCNVTRLPSLAAGQKLDLAEFQAEVRRALGSNFGQFASAAELTSEADYHVLRVTAHGSVAELPIEWRYYHITDRAGRRASLAFTIEERLADQFDQADRELALGLRLLDAPPATAAQPQRLTLRRK